MPRHPELLLLLLVLVGCDDPANTVGVARVHGDEQHGQAIVDALECARCHAPTSKPTMRGCTGCHGAIARAAEHDDHRFLPLSADSAHVRMWNRNIVHFREPPTFVGLTRLLRPAWIVAFLQAPTDLRPRLGESMPHLGIDADDARDVVAYLTSLDAHGAPQRPFFHDESLAEWRSDAGSLPPGDPDRGRTVFAEKGCDSCHVFSGVNKPSLRVVDDEREARSLELAPDLRHTRDRFEPLKIVGWLLEPRFFKHDAAMPDHELTFAEARDLAAFIMTAPIEPDLLPPPVTAPKRRPLLQRTVRYDEVYAAVFGKICVHCHADPSGELGDGGPGFAGGFGFRAKKLDLSDYESTFAGYVADDGKRHSVFAPRNGEPLIVTALWARWSELSSGEIGEVRGMPLALPPLSAEQIQLVESWIAQGRRR